MILKEYYKRWETDPVENLSNDLILGVGYKVSRGFRVGAGLGTRCMSIDKLGVGAEASAYLLS